MRLFIALDIPDAIRSRIAAFQGEIKALAPEVRWVSPESMHVTLKFLGEVPQPRVNSLVEALRTVQFTPFDVRFGGTGFFPNARAARVFWIGMEASDALPELASAVDAACAPFGFEREKQRYKPHLTLARSGSGRPGRAAGDGTNPRFMRLQERLATIPKPEFGTMTSTEFFLYESKLSPRGAQYTKLERFTAPEDSSLNR